MMNLPFIRSKEEETEKVYVPNFKIHSSEEEELKHWGIPRMKWGVRRYQNPDGSLTDEGRAHYGVGPPRAETQAQKRKYKNLKEVYKDRYNMDANELNSEVRRLQSIQQLEEMYKKQNPSRKEINRQKAQKFLKGMGKVVVGTVKFANSKEGGALLEALGLKEPKKEKQGPKTKAEFVARLGELNKSPSDAEKQWSNIEKAEKWREEELQKKKKEEEKK